MTCSYCGTELPPGAMFCGECGRSVTARAAPIIAAIAVETPAEAAELVQPEPALDIAAAQPEPDLEACSQCGAPLAPSDIFCGECGFVRSSVATNATANDTDVLDPFPWGLPRSVEPEPLIEPAAQPLIEPAAQPIVEPAVMPVVVAPAPAPAPDFEDDLDETRIVDRSGRERFVLQFSTGESVRVSGSGLLGRNPVAEPGEYFDALVVISDPGKSVSKTHLEFGQEAGSFWVSDRFSGNGTVVREPDAPPRRCDAGKRYRIVRGTRVDIGEQFFIVS